MGSLRAQINSLTATKSEILALRAEANTQAQGAKTAAQEAVTLMQELQSLEPQVTSVAQSCSGAQAIISQVQAHSSQAQSSANAASSELQQALVLANSCRTKDQAREIDRLFAAAKPKVEKAKFEASQSKNAYNQLKPIFDQAEAARTAQSRASGIAGMIEQLASQSESAFGSANAKSSQAIGLSGKWTGLKNALVGEISSKASSLPSDHPQQSALTMLLGQANAVGQLPPSDVQSHLDSARNDSQRARTFATKAQSTLAGMTGVFLCENITLPEGDFKRADAAEYLASLSLDRSTHLPQTAATCMTNADFIQQQQNAPGGGTVPGGGSKAVDEFARAPGTGWAGDKSNTGQNTIGGTVSPDDVTDISADAKADRDQIREQDQQRTQARREDDKTHDQDWKDTLQRGQDSRDKQEQNNTAILIEQQREAAQARAGAGHHGGPGMSDTDFNRSRDQIQQDFDDQMRTIQERIARNQPRIGGGPGQPGPGGGTGILGTPGAGGIPGGPRQPGGGGGEPPVISRSVGCNSKTHSGGNKKESIAVNVGNFSGTVQFSYNMLREPDQMNVSYGGRPLFNTGCVGKKLGKNSGVGKVPLQLSGQSNQLIIHVNPSCMGGSTKWNFTVTCPR